MELKNTCFVDDLFLSNLSITEFRMLVRGAIAEI